ncbi:MAG: aminopeptidase P family protein [Chloroflexi bacterium]|nr:aminopeptidase P family protein [Chloroflexota bacterium]
MNPSSGMSTTVAPTAFTARLERLQALLAEQELDALVISQQHNRRYLTGFTAGDGSAGESSGWLFVTPAAAWLATSFLYLEQAERETAGLTLAKMETTLAETVAGLIKETGVRRVGFEDADLTVVEHAALAEAKVELVKSGGLVEKLRAIKEEGELATIQRAAALTDAAYQLALEQLRPGISERELAWKLESFLRENGSTGLAFEVAVAFGPSTAIPHAHPGPQRLESGMPYWIDMGARVDGYCADLTRAGWVGRHTADYETYERVYELALAAHALAFERIRPDMTSKAADAVARDLIAASGHGDDFGHSLGHGVGLAVHEAPALSKRYEDALPSGSVVTVEPGIYLPGRFGVRIEDLAVLRDDGLQPLSHAPKHRNL